MKLNERIHLLRKQHYPTQEDAAHAAGVRMNTWSQWERGTVKPEYDSLGKIAAALRISVAELLEGVDSAE